LPVRNRKEGLHERLHERQLAAPSLGPSRAAADHADFAGQKLVVVGGCGAMGRDTPAEPAERMQVGRACALSLLAASSRSRGTPIGGAVMTDGVRVMHEELERLAREQAALRRELAAARLAVGLADGVIEHAKFFERLGEKLQNDIPIRSVAETMQFGVIQ
jgi:hypothetical protein